MKPDTYDRNCMRNLVSNFIPFCFARTLGKRTDWQYNGIVFVFLLQANRLFTDTHTHIHPITHCLFTIPSIPYEPSGPLRISFCFGTISRYDYGIQMSKMTFSFVHHCSIPPTDTVILLLASIATRP